MSKRLLPALLPFLLAACAVGPDFDRPTPPAEHALGPIAEAPSGTADLSATWWQLYHSPALDHLIDEALAHNADLAAAQAALLQAQEIAASNEGVFYPSLQGGIQAQRQKDPTGSVQPTAADGSPQLTLFTPQLTVSYTPDIWGGNRRAQEGLEAQSRAQAFQTEATRLTLTSNLVVAAINEASLRGQLSAAERIVTIARDSLRILDQKLALGAVAETDRLAQESALAQAEQAVAPLVRQVQQQRHQLTALLGRLPADEPTETFTLDDLHLPAEMPFALPSKLVAQRPDIRIADANLQAASAQIGVAIANRLPNLTLDAALGSSTNTVQSLFTPGSGFWSVSGTITAPLFDGFSLLHRERAARAAYDQAAAAYRSTVITAFQNAVDCLSALQSDEKAEKSALRADQAAHETFLIARKQLALGDISPLDLMNAEQADLQAHMTLVQASANRLTDSAALLQALGGGWWNRPDSGLQVD